MSISSIRKMDSSISEIASAGYYIGLRVGFYAPEAEINTFPDEWVEKYTVNALALFDPLRRWSLTNTGTMRWSSLEGSGRDPVLRLYAEFGCRYGAIMAISKNNEKSKRSIAYFSKGDREFTEDEIRELYDILLIAHSVSNSVTLTSAQAEALRLSADGLRHKQIAYELQISESAVKARLKSAMERLGARTPTQAASIASLEGLI